MKLFDELIHEVLSACEDYKGKPLAVSNKEWPDDGNNGIILRSDMAYELGGGTLPAVTCQMITNSYDLVPEDRIMLYGPDLDEIHEDTPYARIVLLRTKEKKQEEKDSQYSIIRSMEYRKYQVHPHGYMARISSIKHREPVRVSRKALKEGLNYTLVGNQYRMQYKKDKEVEAVSILFITDPAFPYDILKQKATKAEQITEALDHVLKGFSMDCATCKLKEVCEEVEEIKELHFKNI